MYEIDHTFLLSHIHTSKVMPFLTVSGMFVVCRAFVSLVLRATVFALPGDFRAFFRFLFTREMILFVFGITTWLLLEVLAVLFSYEIHFFF